MKSAMKSHGTAVWEGGLKPGNGRISTASGALSGVPYTFGTRFEGVPGTNPEELVAAAHAACFSMALSGELEKRGACPVRIETQATTTIERQGEGFAVTSVDLSVECDVEGIGSDGFDEAARSAKDNCPISKLLNARITMQARLAGKAA